MKRRSNQAQAMHEYLDALLFEVESPAPQQALLETEKLERLLAQATLRQQREHAASAQLEAEFARAAALEQAQVEQAQIAQTQHEQPAAEPEPLTHSMAAYHSGEFQALFFEVAGLKLAVPLKSLGGIHKWQTPNSIFGKPAWYLGIMSNREESLNVVDTARWVMPEKYTPQMAAALNYQYLIMLGESQWGLACERLVTTEVLAAKDIQWRRNSQGKRPWLAGVVRDKMCAILDVEAMTGMFDQGLSSRN